MKDKPDGLLDIFLMSDPTIVQFPVYLHASQRSVELRLPAEREEFKNLGRDSCLEFDPETEQVQVIYDWFEDIVGRTIAPEHSWSERDVKPFCDDLVAQFEKWWAVAFINRGKILDMLVPKATVRSDGKWKISFTFDSEPEIITLTTSQLDSPKYLARCFRDKGLVLSLTPDDWNAITNMLTRDSRYHEPDRSLDPVTLVVDDVLDYLCSGHVVKVKEEALDPMSILYAEGDLYLRNKQIAIIESGRIHAGSERETWWKLTESLMPYRSTEINDDGEEVVKPPKTLRIHSHKYRFWRFDPEKCGVDLQQQLELWGDSDEEIEGGDACP